MNMRHKWHRCWLLEPFSHSESHDIFQMGHTGRRWEKCVPHGLRCFGLACGLDGGDASASSAGCRRSGGGPTRLACSELLATGLGFTSCKKHRFWRWNSVKPMRQNIDLSEKQCLLLVACCPFLAFPWTIHEKWNELKGLLGFLQSFHGIADVVVHAMACDAAGRRTQVLWDLSQCLNSNAGKGIFQIIGKRNDGNNAMNAYECNIFTIGSTRCHDISTPRHFVGTAHPLQLRYLGKLTWLPFQPSECTRKSLDPGVLPSLGFSAHVAASGLTDFR